MKHTVLLCAAVILAVFLAWVAWMAWPREESMPREASIEELLAALPPLPQVADAENGWLLSKNLPPAQVRPEMKGRRPFILPRGIDDDEVYGVDGAFVLQYQKDNPEIIATTRRILQLPKWQYVRDDRPVPIPAEYQPNVMFPARVILAAAVLPGLSGDHEKSWPDILAVMKLGRRISEGGGAVMETLHGCLLTSQAAEAAGRVGQFMNDSTTARRIAAEMLPLEDGQVSYQRGLEGELYYMLRVNEVFRRGGAPVERILVEHYLNLARVQYELARGFSQTAQDSDGFPGEAASKTAPEIPAFPGEEWKAKWLKEPPAGLARTLEQLNDTNYDELARKAVEAFRRNRNIKITTWADFRADWRARSEQAGGEDESMTTAGLILQNLFSSIAQIRLTRVSLLLRAWTLEHGGQLPDSLEALVPDYLPELPVDPYDGKPLRYDKERLWSVGSDLKDDGGKTRDDMVQPL
jgi:hypothetical protein